MSLSSYLKSKRFSQLLTWICLITLVCDFGARSLLRWHYIHHETFDLAFYLRITWGLIEGDFWNPLVGGSIWGLRISPILYPLGLLGRFLGLAPTLLIAQVLAVAGAGWMMSRIVARRLGAEWGWLGAFAWLAYPHLGHVVTYEFHPGTLALFPLVTLMDAYDRSSGKGCLWSALGVLLCREDLAVILIGWGIFAAYQRPQFRTVALSVIASAALWLGLFTLVLHPQFAPPHGSMSLHFGHWGETTSNAITFMITHPHLVIAHLCTPPRLLYLLKLSLPLLGTPLRGLLWLLPALPILGMNLLSQFPGVTALDSHYLTPALPFILIAGFEGLTALLPFLEQLGRSHHLTQRFWIALWGGVLGIAHLWAGGTPIARDYPQAVWRSDHATDHARAILALIPAEGSVQVPDRLTPHLAERAEVYRAKGTPQGADYVVIDTREPQHQALRAILHHPHSVYHQRLISGSLQLWVKDLEP